MIYLIILILIIQVIHVILFIQFVNFYIRNKDENNKVLPVIAPTTPVKQRWEDDFLKEQEAQRKNAEIQKQDTIII